MIPYSILFSHLWEQQQHINYAVTNTAHALVLAGVGDPFWVNEQAMRMPMRSDKAVPQLSPRALTLCGMDPLAHRQNFRLAYHSLYTSSWDHPLGLFALHVVGGSSERELLEEAAFLAGEGAYSLNRFRDEHFPVLPKPLPLYGIPFLKPMAYSSSSDVLPPQFMPLYGLPAAARYSNYEEILKVDRLIALDNTCPELDAGPMITSMVHRVFKQLDTNKLNFAQRWLRYLPAGSSVAGMNAELYLMAPGATPLQRVDGVRALAGKYSSVWVTKSKFVQRIQPLTVEAIVGCRSQVLPEILNDVPWETLRPALEENRTAISAHLFKFASTPAILESCLRDHDARPQVITADVPEQLAPADEVLGYIKKHTAIVSAAARKVLRLSNGDRYLAALYWAVSEQLVRNEEAAKYSHAFSAEPLKYKAVLDALSPEALECAQKAWPRIHGLLTE